MKLQWDDCFVLVLVLCSTACACCGRDGWAIIYLSFLILFVLHRCSEESR